MADGNPDQGHLSEAEAMEILRNRRTGSDNDEAEIQAGQDPEVEDDEEVSEEIELEAEGESDDMEDDASPSDEDKEEEIDQEELERGYLRHADYTRKTQEHADKVRADEARLSAKEAQIQQQLDVLKANVEAFAIPTEQEPNWAELAAELEPKEYQQRQAQWQQKQAQRNQAAQLYQQMQEAELSQRQESERRALLDKLPEWSDPTVLQADTKAMIEVAAAVGYTADDVAGINDHRQLLLLRELAAMKRTAKAKRKAPAPKKRVAPAAAPRKDVNAEVEQATARLRKSGSSSDALALLKLKRAARG